MIKRNSFGSKYINIPTDNINSRSAASRRTGVYLKGRHLTKMMNMIMIIVI
jgi:hypothetical protein